MDKKIILTGLLLGFVSIVLGAFGAHKLKDILSAEHLSSFEVGVRYMMYHALFLLFIGNTPLLLDKQKNSIYYLALIGTLFFSLSIFLLTTTEVTRIDFKFLGPITPLGGLFLITSWAMAFYYVIVKK